MSLERSWNGKIADLATLVRRRVIRRMARVAMMVIAAPPRGRGLLPLVKNIQKGVRIQGGRGESPVPGVSGFGVEGQNECGILLYLALTRFPGRVVNTS